MTQQSFPSSGGAGSTWSWAVRLAVLVSVASTVAADIAAGAATGHVLTLALVASVVAVIRIRAVGHYRGLWNFVSAGLVAQPAFHATADLARHISPIGPHDHTSTATSGLTAAVQAVVAAAIVATVCLTERVVELALSEVAAYLQAIHLTPPVEPAAPRWIATPSTGDNPGLSSRLEIGSIARRGPPVMALAA
jgi:hypothetical protein